jgi:AraC-like DNA-binding protein
MRKVRSLARRLTRSGPPAIIDDRRISCRLFLWRRSVSGEIRRSRTSATDAVVNITCKPPECRTARQSDLAQVLFASLEHSDPFDRAVLAGILCLSHHRHGRIEQLSHCLGVSERQLHRRFLAAVGYSPKMFQSVLRFQRLLQTERQTSADQSLADLAASAGHADQAHMTRDLHRFANIQPTILLRSTLSTLQMSDLFKT